MSGRHVLAAFACVALGAVAMRVVAPPPARDDHTSLDALRDEVVALREEVASRREPADGVSRDLESAVRVGVRSELERASANTAPVATPDESVDDEPSDPAARADVLAVVDDAERDGGWGAAHADRFREGLDSLAPPDRIAAMNELAVAFNTGRIRLEPGLRGPL